MSFEKHIRRQVKHHRSEVDVDNLWVNIEAELEEDRRRPFAVWWFVLAGVLLVSGAGLFWYVGTGASRLADLPSNDSPTHAWMSTGMLTAVPSTPSAIATHPVGILQNQLLPARHVVTVPVVINHTSAFAHSIPPPPKGMPSLTMPPPYGDEGAIRMISPYRENGEQVIIADQQGRSASAIPQKGGREQGEAPLSKQTVGENPEKIPSLRALVEWEEDEPLVASETETETSTRRVKVGVGIWWGYAHTNKRLSAKNPESGYYVHYRQDSEQHRRTVEVGGDVIVRFPKGLGIRTGLAYTVIREDFVLPDFLINSITGSVPSYSNRQDADRMGHALLDPDASTSPDAFKPPSSTPYFGNGVRNTYEIIDLPIVFNYEVGAKKVRLNLEAGGYLNLSTVATGAMRSHLGRPMRLSSHNYPFRKSVGLSPYMGMSLGYQLNAHTSVIAKGHYRVSALSLTRADNPLSQHSSIMGVNLGIRYMLD